MWVTTTVDIIYDIPQLQLTELGTAAF